jgi:large subunit ribosomal protein L33
LKLKKFDPWAIHPETGKKGAHVYFEEKKMPPSKK